MKRTVKYNKLIRDKIPQIIREAGWMPVVITLNRKECIEALKKKILEEAKELIRAKGKKEVADEIIDIQEILDALVIELGLKKVEIKKWQRAKNKKRGKFRKRLFLIKEYK